MAIPGAASVTEVEVFMVEQKPGDGVLIALFDGAKDGSCVGIISCRFEAARQLCKDLGSVLKFPKT